MKFSFKTMSTRQWLILGILVVILVGVASFMAISKMIIIDDSGLAASAKGGKVMGNRRLVCGLCVIPFVRGNEFGLQLPVPGVPSTRFRLLEESEIPVEFFDVFGNRLDVDFVSDYGDSFWQVNVLHIKAKYPTSEVDSSRDESNE